MVGGVAHSWRAQGPPPPGVVMCRICDRCLPSSSLSPGGPACRALDAAAPAARNLTRARPLIREAPAKPVATSGRTPLDVSCRICDGRLGQNRSRPAPAGAVPTAATSFVVLCSASPRSLAPGPPTPLAVRPTMRAHLVVPCEAPACFAVLRCVASSPASSAAATTVGCSTGGRPASPTGRGRPDGWLPRTVPGVTAVSCVRCPGLLAAARQFRALLPLQVRAHTPRARPLHGHGPRKPVSSRLTPRRHWVPPAPEPAGAPGAAPAARLMGQATAPSRPPHGAPAAAQDAGGFCFFSLSLGFAKALGAPLARPRAQRLACFRSARRTALAMAPQRPAAGRPWHRPASPWVLRVFLVAGSPPSVGRAFGELASLTPFALQVSQRTAPVPAARRPLHRPGNRVMRGFGAPAAPGARVLQARADYGSQLTEGLSDNDIIFFRRYFPAKLHFFV
ncbi:hypothetical protein ACSSS7_007696 [Eimeria intestinalis]